MYKDLSDHEEKRSFEAFLDAFLPSQDEEQRRFAVDICLGLRQLHLPIKGEGITVLWYR